RSLVLKASPSMLAVTRALGLFGPFKSMRGPQVGVPGTVVVLRKTLTDAVPERPELATARSGRKSPLKSLTVMAAGLALAGKFKTVAAAPAKPPAPLERKMLTVLLVASATARSGALLAARLNAASAVAVDTDAPVGAGPTVVWK